MTLENQWIITPGATETAPGTIIHRKAPAFQAKWQTGTEGLEDMSGPFWYDGPPGNEDDTLLIFGFEWDDGPPETAELEALMKSSAKALDQWIASQF